MGSARVLLVAFGLLVPALALAAEADTPAGDDTAAAGQLRAEGRDDARRLVAEGRAFEAAGRFPEARDAYRQAVLADATLREARLGVDRVQGILAGDALGGGALDERAVAERALAEVEIRVSLAEADRLASDGLVEQARELCGSVRELIRQHRWDHYADDLAATQQRIDALSPKVRDQHNRDRDRARAEALTAAGDLMIQRQGQRDIVYDQRIEEIILQKTRRNYELSLSLCRRLVSDYPGRQPGEALYEDCLDKVHRQRTVDLAERNRLLKQETFERIHRAMIPYNVDGTPLYPETWFDVQAKREAPWLGTTVEREVWRSEIQNQLETPMDVNFRQMAVADALDLFGRLARVNLVVDAEVRAMDLPVDLLARQMTAGNVLDWLCRQTGLQWSLRNEAIWVGGEVIDESLIRIYDVTQLVHAPPDFTGVGLRSFFNQNGNLDFGEELEAEITVEPEDLVDLMQQAVAPGAWDNPDNTITIRGNRLFVRAPLDVHDLIAQFLRSQEAANNQQVFLRLSWLEITDGYLEEIGVDWTNARRNNLLDHPFSNSGFRRTQREWSILGDLVNSLPDVAVQGSRQVAQAVAPGGLALQWLQLPSPQISAMLVAEENSQKVRSLNEIELCTLDGVRSTVFIGGQRSVITGLSVSGDDGGELDPDITTITYGQSFDIKPFVSADRKYVSLQLRPILADYEIERQVLSVTRNLAPANALLPIVRQSEYTIELPFIRVSSAGTRVMVPDRGSILVGGFQEVREQHASSKIPILGHIPFLGRLFGKRGRYSNKSRLFLRLSARIILYEEEEANL